MLLLFTASCGNYVYKATSMRTAMLKEKNDVNAQWNASNAGTEVFAAYAPINYLAFSAGYAFKKDTSAALRTRFHDIEFSAIPFYAKNRLRLEMPMGFAYTSRSSLDNAFPTFQPYSRFYVQPAVGFSWDYFDIAFQYRMTFIDYQNAAYKQDVRSQFGLMLRAGVKNVKFMAQFSIDQGTNNSNLVDYFPSHLSLGLNFYFNAATAFKPKTKTAN